MRKLHYISIIILLAVSCSEPIDWDLKYEEEPLLIVQGKITNERKAHEVILSEPVYEMNGDPVYVSGARVRLSDGDTIFELTEDTGRTGVYLTHPTFQAAVNRTYILNIEVDTFEFRAVARMAPVTPFQEMWPYRVQDDPPLFELWITNSDEPAVVKIEMDWSHVPGYEDLPVEETHATIYHYTLESIDVNKLFPPEADHVRFPARTIAIRSKESVSEGYEEFLRGMLSETVWRGGLFDVLPGNAYTNITGDKAAGYFVATTVIRDTVDFQPGSGR